MTERKSTLLMTDTDWSNFNLAIDTLFDDGIYETFVMHHAATGTNSMAKHRMHGSMSGRLGFLRFLPWHRAYLSVFERALKNINTDAFIPYWDWTKENKIPSQIIELPNNNRHSRAVDFTNENEISNIKSNSDFYSFVRQLEVGPHNRGHNFIGGIMGNPMLSPRDPMFWLHHANVDRIWTEWQNIPGNAQKNGDFTGYNPIERMLDPWASEFNVDNINDISNLGSSSYKYGPREATP